MTSGPLTGQLERVKSPEEELLDLLAIQARRVPIAAFVVLALLAVVIHRHSPGYGWAIWFTAVAAVLVVRFIVLTRLPSMSELGLRARLNIAAALSGINGVTHASSLYYFPAMTDVERSIQSLILAGLAVAAIATTAGDRRIYLAYFLPIFPMLSFLYATEGNGTLAQPLDVSLGAAIGVFAIMLLFLARDANRQFLETIGIRKDQEDLNRQLQNALQNAAVADRAKTRFLAAASHDLRQPIHALSLFGAALKIQQLPDNARELVNNIDESINVLASQLDSLLDMSRLDAGVVTPEIELIDLTSMLRRIGREFEQQVQDKGLTLNLRVVDDCFVISDRLLLERVIRNLLNNAVRYTEKGDISIETKKVGRHCRLAIIDTGIGIPESEHDNIFGEFYQVSQEYGASKQGLGLGLSIVTRLLELLDVPLEIESTVGEGTRIEVKLTLERGEQDAAGEHEAMRLDGVSVLVIDSDIAVRTAVKALLDDFGAVTHVASNLREALGIAGSVELDVVLSDLLLGTESGIDAIDRIREVHGDVRAILVTGDTSAEQIQQAQRAGYEILHKPVNPAELKKKIADVVHQH